MVETAVPVEGGCDACGCKQISRPLGQEHQAKKRPLLRALKA